MNPVDSVIRFLAPGWAEARLGSRYRMEMAEKARSAYDAGSKDREWVTAGAAGTAESINSQDRNTIMLRARAMERNSDMVNAIISSFSRNVVGSGIRPQMRIRDEKGRLNSKLNKFIEKQWSKWCKANSCDITGTQTFYEMLDTLLQRRIIDGECFVRFIYDKSQKIGLKLQCLEADSLDGSASDPKKIVLNGVEVNNQYKPLAYWFQEASPDGWVSVGKSIRVPAEQILHVFKKTRFTQVRGVSELAPVLRRIREVGEYIDAEIVGAKIRAFMSMIIVTPDAGPAGAMFGGGKSGSPQKMTDVNGEEVSFVQRGAIAKLSPGSDIRTVGGQGTAGNVTEFTKLETRLGGAGMGLSYEAVGRDMSMSSYSSARQGSLEDRATYKKYQDYLKEHVCQPVFDKFLESLALAGLIPMDYFSDPDKYEVEWVTPGWQWIDPQKDVAATKEELMAGLTTLSETCSERGQDWESVLEQRAEEVQKARDLKLLLDIDKPKPYSGGDGNAQGDTGSPADGPK